MVCYNEDNKYTLDEINDMLVEWAESKDIYLGGSVKPCVPEETSDETAALPLHDVMPRFSAEEMYGFAIWFYRKEDLGDFAKYRHPINGKDDIETYQDIIDLWQNEA